MSIEYGQLLLLPCLTRPSTPSQSLPYKLACMALPLTTMQMQMYNDLLSFAHKTRVTTSAFEGLGRDHGVKQV
jgi:hypothetical protein